MNTVLFAIYVVFILANLLCGFRAIRSGREHRLKIGRVWEGCTVETVAAFLLAVLLLYIAVHTTDVPDVENYSILYKYMTNNIEIGYRWAEYIGHAFKLSFEGFRIIFLVSAFIVMWMGILRLGTNKNIVLGLFAIYPFTMDAIQIRTFMAVSIMIYATHYLRQNVRFSKSKFIACVILSTLFHMQSLAYLLLLLVNYKPRKGSRQKLLIMLFSGALLIAVVLKASGSFLNVFSKYLFFFNSEKGDAYATGTVRWGFLILWLRVLLYVLSAYELKKIFDNQKTFSRESVFANQLFWINISMACTMPLLIVNINFYRLFRGISLLNYCLLPLFLTCRGKQIRWKIGFVFFILAFISSAYGDLIQDMDYVFWSFFQ